MQNNCTTERMSHFLSSTFRKASFLFCFCALSAYSLDANARERYENIIPKPQHVEVSQGNPFVLTPKTIITYDAAVKAQAAYLQETLAGSTGFDLVMKEGNAKKGISLQIDQKEVTKAEGYQLSVNSKGVCIKAHDAAGAFYGIQTLLQLFPEEVHSAIRHKDIAWEINPISICDAPNRPWRGMMLDVARYFYDKEFVKKYIDMMAMYKLNKLQMHMIDDSGWRLEIKKYPKLTEIGAWAGTDTHRLGGFYTQEDIKEMLAYAEVRGVEIIPEIEFPAHMLSAVVAYPWLSCTGLQHELPVQHFISRDLLCVGKETSIQFIRDILEETVNLFPSKYINIGGDEAVYSRWEECPRCQAVMKREGLKKASELQGYLTNVVAEMMKEKGKTIVGWEEIMLRGKVNTPVVGLFWHNVGDTIHAKELGHKAILTPATHMYYDFPEGSTPGEVKAAGWMPPVSVEKTYSMPINDYSENSTTMGVQACFWSDQFIHGTILQEIPYINENRSEQYAEYLTFPRLLALSEVAWGRQAERDYPDFRTRLSKHFARLDAKGCNYRVPEPIVEELKQEANGSFTYKLATPIEGAVIRYTTDGNYPNTSSKIYTEPVNVKSKDDFRAITVLSPRHYSLPVYSKPDYSAYKQYGKYSASWKPLQIQKTPNIFRFECTGKIAGNGEYEVTFIQNRGTNALKLGTLKLWKRDELMAEVKGTYTVADKQVATYSFKVDQFEAGTPFFIDVMANGVNGNDTAGLIFIRKK